MRHILPYQRGDKLSPNLSQGVYWSYTQAYIDTLNLAYIWQFDFPIKSTWQQRIDSAVSKSDFEFLSANTMQQTDLLATL